MAKRLSQAEYEYLLNSLPMEGGVNMTPTGGRMSNAGFNNVTNSYLNAQKSGRLTPGVIDELSGMKKNFTMRDPYGVPSNFGGSSAAKMNSVRPPAANVGPLERSIPNLGEQRLLGQTVDVAEDIAGNISRPQNTFNTTWSQMADDPAMDIVKASKFSRIAGPGLKLAGKAAGPVLGAMTGDPVMAGMGLLPTKATGALGALMYSTELNPEGANPFTDLIETPEGKTLMQRIQRRHENKQVPTSEIDAQGGASGSWEENDNTGGATGEWGAEKMEMPAINVDGQFSPASPSDFKSAIAPNRRKTLSVNHPGGSTGDSTGGSTGPQKDPAMQELEEALRGRKDALYSNNSQYRDLASKLGVHQQVPGFGGLTDYVNYTAGTNFKPAHDETFDQKQTMLQKIQSAVAKGNVDGTQPDIDLANTRMKLDKYNEQMAFKKEQAALNRASAEKRTNQIMAGKLANAMAKASGGNKKGIDAFNKKTGEEYGQYTSGGKEALNSTGQVLDSAMARLKGAKTGGWKAAAYKLAPDALKGFVAADMKALVDDVIAPVFETLRAKIGAQFTERESRQLQSLAFDPALSKEQNMKKINNAIYILKSKQEALQNKFSYFENNNQDMTGFKMPKSSIEYPSYKKPKNPKAPGGGNKKFEDMSIAELKAYNEG